MRPGAATLAGVEGLEAHRRAITTRIFALEGKAFGARERSVA